MSAAPVRRKNQGLDPDDKDDFKPQTPVTMIRPASAAHIRRRGNTPMGTPMTSSLLRGRIALAAMAALGMIGWTAAPAPATVTIGSDLSSAASNVFLACGGFGTCTFVQVTGTNLTAPGDGVIVRYRLRKFATSSNYGTVALRVLRPGGAPGTFTGAGTGSTHTTAGTPVVSEFPAQLPIRAGDQIGINTSSGVPVRSLTGARCALFDPALADGSTAAPNLTCPSNTEVLFNADVEPDCDSDGFGDETQDPDTSSCNPAPPAAPKADGTLTIDANKGKVVKGRKVTLTGQLDVAANESCEPGRQVQIQRRLKSEDDSNFETFETATTEAAGNFTLKVKVKKTYFYRALVGETAACDDETSSSQKVRVQKKKAAQEA